MKNRPPIRYRIRPGDPAAHLFVVECTVADPDPAAQRLRLPAWIPGSYLVREFARQSSRSRRTRGARSPLKSSTSTVARRTRGGPLTVTPRCTGGPSVRGGISMSPTASSTGPASACGCAGGGARARGDIVLRRPAAAGWGVATPLPRNGAPARIRAHRAADYDELVDHPVEMGTFRTAHSKRAVSRTSRDHRPARFRLGG